MITGYQLTVSIHCSSSPENVGSTKHLTFPHRFWCRVHRTGKKCLVYLL